MPSAKLENLLNDLTINDESKSHIQEKNDVKNEITDQDEINEQKNMKHRSVSAIVEELQRDLKRPHMEVIIFFLYKYIYY